MKQFLIYAYSIASTRKMMNTYMVKNINITIVTSLWHASSQRFFYKITKMKDKINIFAKMRPVKSGPLVIKKALQIEIIIIPL